MLQVIMLVSYWIFGNLGPENIIDGLKKQRDENLNRKFPAKGMPLAKDVTKNQEMMKVKLRKKG